MMARVWYMYFVYCKYCCKYISSKYLHTCHVTCYLQSLSAEYECQVPRFISIWWASTFSKISSKVHVYLHNIKQEIKMVKLFTIWFHQFRVFLVQRLFCCYFSIKAIVVLSNHKSRDWELRIRIWWNHVVYSFNAFSM